MDEPTIEASGKTVFILEDFPLESVEDKIVALGYAFQKRRLVPKPSNWLEIVKDLKQLNASGDLLAVLMFLSETTLFYTSSSEYLEVWHNLLMEFTKAT